MSQLDQPSTLRIATDVNREVLQQDRVVERNLRSKVRTPKRFRRYLASWSRWLHIYLSMLGLAVILFFSVTGFTLNHPDWFFAEHTTQETGQVDLAWLNNHHEPPVDWDEYDYGHQVAKLEVAEYLRAKHQLRGRVSDFLAFADECEVTFEGPGYLATASIARVSGQYDLNVTTSDLVSILNDLHKGRHTGWMWSLLIDTSAIIGTLVGLSGFVLIFFLRLRRVSGLLAALAGVVVLGVFYVLATR